MRELTYSEFLAAYSTMEADDIEITDYTAVVDTTPRYQINGVSFAGTRSQGIVLALRFHYEGYYSNTTSAEAVIATEYMTDSHPLWPYINQLRQFKLVYEFLPERGKFDWYDHDNGKGVITRMTDARNNTLPYDWINIQFMVFSVLQAAPLGIPSEVTQEQIDIYTRMLPVIKNCPYAFPNYIGEQELYGSDYDGYNLEPDGTRGFVFLDNNSLGTVDGTFIAQIDLNHPAWVFGFQDLATLESGIFPSNDLFVNISVKNALVEGDTVYHFPYSCFYADSRLSNTAPFKDIDIESAYMSIFHGQIYNMGGWLIMNSIINTSHCNVLMFNLVNRLYIGLTVNSLAFVKDVDNAILGVAVTNYTFYREIQNEIINFDVDYGNYWRLAFRNIANELYELRIYGAEGNTPISLTGVQDPLECSEESDKFILYPVRTKTFSLSLIGSSELMELLPQPDSFRTFALFKDGVQIEMGTLKPDVFRSNIFDPHSTQKFHMICPLFTVKNIMFEYTTGDYREMWSIGVMLANAITQINEIMPGTINTIVIDYGEQFFGGDNVPADKAWMHGMVQGFFLTSMTVYSAISAFCSSFGLTARLHKNVLYLLAIDDNHRGRDLVEITQPELWLSAVRSDYIAKPRHVELTEKEFFNGPFSGVNNTYSTTQTISRLEVKTEKNISSDDYSFINEKQGRPYYYNSAVKSAIAHYEGVYYRRYTKYTQDNYSYLDSKTGIRIGGNLTFRYTSVRTAKDEDYDPNLFDQTPSPDTFYPEIRLTNVIYSQHYKIAETIGPVFVYNADLSLSYTWNRYSNESGVPGNGHARIYVKDINNKTILSSDINQRESTQTITFKDGDYFYGLLYIWVAVEGNQNIWIRNIELSIKPRVVDSDIDSVFVHTNNTVGYNSKKSFTIPLTQDNTTPCITNRVIGIDYYNNGAYESNRYIHATNILDRMTRYYSVMRKAYSLALLEKTETEVTPITVTWYGNKLLYPISTKKNYGKDSEEVTFIEIDV